LSLRRTRAYIAYCYSRSLIPVNNSSYTLRFCDRSVPRIREIDEEVLCVLKEKVAQNNHSYTLRCFSRIECERAGSLKIITPSYCRSICSGITNCDCLSAGSRQADRKIEVYRNVLFSNSRIVNTNTRLRLLRSYLCHKAISHRTLARLQ